MRSPKKKKAEGAIRLRKLSTVLPFIASTQNFMKLSPADIMESLHVFVHPEQAPAEVQARVKAYKDKYKIGD